MPPAMKDATTGWDIAKRSAVMRLGSGGLDMPGGGCCNKDKLGSQALREWLTYQAYSAQL